MAVEKAPEPPPARSNVARLLEQALALSVADREALLAALQDSLEPADGKTLTQEEWETGWSTEIKRRVDNLEAGRTRLYSHDEVMAELEAGNSEALSQDWGAELRRRMDEYRSGRAETYSFEEVMSELRAGLHQR